MRRAVTLDTNLFLLFVVGLASRDFIKRYRRTRSDYDEDDFDALVALIQAGTELVTIPNTMTEASNLLRQSSDPDRSMILTAFQSVLRTRTEYQVTSADAARRHDFSWLGLADCALLEVATRHDLVILTADSNLAIAAGYERAIYFKHLPHRRTR